MTYQNVSFRLYPFGQFNFRFYSAHMSQILTDITTENLGFCHMKGDPMWLHLNVHMQSLANTTSLWVEGSIPIGNELYSITL